MRRRFSVAALFSMAITLLASVNISAQCPEGLELGPDLGIGLIQCFGGECVRYRDPKGRLIYDLTSEPVLRLIDAGRSPSGLEEGDTLVALNGKLVTSVAGGILLGNPPADQRLTLTVRREGVLRDVTVLPVLLCHRSRLLVSTLREVEQGTWIDDLGMQPFAPRTVVVGRDANRLQPAGSIGVTLSCRGCTWVLARNGSLQWSSPVPPVVSRVRNGGPAFRAGIQPGDLLTHVNGLPVDEPQGGLELGRARPGDVLGLRVRRGDQTLELSTLVEEPHEGGDS